MAMLCSLIPTPPFSFRVLHVCWAAAGRVQSTSCSDDSESSHTVYPLICNLQEIARLPAMTDVACRLASTTAQTLLWRPFPPLGRAHKDASSQPAYSTDAWLPGLFPLIFRPFSLIHRLFLLDTSPCFP